MAKVTIKQFRARQFGQTPYGNLSALAFQLVTAAGGGATNADSSAALAIGDVVDLGPLPAGMRLDDCQIIVSDAMSASVTASLGFAYEDGVDSTAVPQDAAYFGTGLALSSAARLRANSSKALKTPVKPARLILTIAGAANAEAAKIDVVVTGEMTGPK